jgi:GxxExxY protein
MNHEDAKFAKREEERRREEENRRMRTLGDEVERLAYQVIGAAIEVHRVLGPGYLERVYQKALKVELDLRGIPHRREHPIAVNYKDNSVGEGRLDFLVGDILVVELKAVDSVAPIHEAIVMSYLKTTNLPLALIINFRVTLLKEGLKRIILTP